MYRRFLRAAFATALVCLASARFGGDALARHRESRTLITHFTYRAAVSSLPPDTRRLRLWIPIPSESAWQTIRGLAVEAPGPYRITHESRYGNRMVYVEVQEPHAPIAATVSFIAQRREPRILAGAAEDAARIRSGPLRLYLQPERKVPVGGRYREMAAEVAAGQNKPLAEAKAIFDHVVATMHYDYKQESPHYAEGDAAFVCDYKKGNCSDLHSYVVSLARSLGIPAYIEFGFPITGVPPANPVPSEGSIGGYHCWTWFHDGAMGWVPLDASDGRRWVDAGHPEVKDQLFGGLIVERSAVAISRGRDITLSPAQKGAPLNYFIYPYAEADGASVKADWEVRYQLPDSSHGPR